MCKKCKNPIIEKKYVSIGMQTERYHCQEKCGNTRWRGNNFSKAGSKQCQSPMQLVPKKQVTENTLIFKNNNNSTYDFYNGKTSWNGSNNTFRELSHQYLFIPVKRNETLEEAYARITVESEELMEKSNGEINMKITENYLKTTLELFCKKSKATNYK